jgi:cellulose synthase (UDP-forming)
MMRESLGYLVFPTVLALTLLLLRVGLYRDLADINRIFDDRKRPGSLAGVVSVLMVVMIGIVVVTQALRIPFYGSLLYSLRHMPRLAESLGLAALMVVSAVAELAVLVHLGVTLFFTWVGATRFSDPEPPPPPNEAPPVAVLVPSCDEDPEALARSLSTISRIRYPRVRVLLVENSRNQAFKYEAHAVAARYGVEILDLPNRGHKAGALNDAEALLGDDLKYTVVFDADQVILNDFITEAVALLEADQRLAVVQTPQVYENCRGSLLACAAAQQQMLLYDCIAEAKSVLRRVPCYGTNFLIRRQALQDVGGWDESNLTEDLTTSYNLHARGWTSRYLRRISAAGLAPPTLSGYWKQQLRWANGNTVLFLSVLRRVFSRQSVRVPASVVADYLWTSSFFLTTCAVSLLAVLPTAVLMISLLGGLPDRVDSSSLELAFLSLYPLYLGVLLFPYINMRLRGYPLRNMILVQGLVSISSPVFLRGVGQAMFSRPGTQLMMSSTKVFRPGNVNPERILLTPQSLAFALFVVAGSVLWSWAIAGRPGIVPWIAGFWAFFHALSLGHFFIFAIEERRLTAAAACATVGTFVNPPSSQDTIFSDSESVEGMREPRMD